MTLEISSITYPDQASAGQEVEIGITVKTDLARYIGIKVIYDGQSQWVVYNHRQWESEKTYPFTFTIPNHDTVVKVELYDITFAPSKVDEESFTIKVSGQCPIPTVDFTVIE